MARSGKNIPQMHETAGPCSTEILVDQRNTVDVRMAILAELRRHDGQSVDSLARKLGFPQKNVACVIRKSLIGYFTERTVCARTLTGEMATMKLVYLKAGLHE
jgi:predicted transcriptional regulator